VITICRYCKMYVGKNGEPLLRENRNGFFKEKMYSGLGQWCDSNGIIFVVVVCCVVVGGCCSWRCRLVHWSGDWLYVVAMSCIQTLLLQVAFAF